jgi:hypothetical protein
VSRVPKPATAHEVSLQRCICAHLASLYAERPQLDPHVKLLHGQQASFAAYQPNLTFEPSVREFLYLPCSDLIESQQPSVLKNTQVRLSQLS